MSDTAFPIVSVRDLPAAQKFYERLGFVPTYRFPPDGDATFVTMGRGDASIGIAVTDDPDSNRFAYWVYVDDVDASFEELRSIGVEVVTEPKDEPWGERVASIRDPDGNLVHIGATLQP